jgi:hypothetical protein
MHLRLVRHFDCRKGQCPAIQPGLRNRRCLAIAEGLSEGFPSYKQGFELAIGGSNGLSISRYPPEEGSTEV